MVILGQVRVAKTMTGKTPSTKNSLVRMRPVICFKHPATIAGTPYSSAKCDNCTAATDHIAMTVRHTVLSHLVKLSACTS